MNDGAVAAALRRLALATEDGAAWRDAGEALAAAGEIIDACAALGEAIRLAPQDLAAGRSFASAAVAAGRAEEALARARSLAEAADQPAALLAMARLLADLGRLDQAIVVAEKLAERAPDAFPARAELALLYRRRAADEAAEGALRAALAMSPDDEEMLAALGDLLIRQNRSEAARPHLARVVQLAPEKAERFKELALCHLRLGRQMEARAAAEAAIAAAPDDPQAHRVLSVVLAYCDGVGGEELSAALRRCGALWPRAAPRRFSGDRDPDRRLRVGLLGGAFRRHPTTLLTLRGLEGLDPDSFALHCFSGGGIYDDYTRRWRDIAADWAEIGGDDDRSVAARIQAAGIDILIDMGGYLNNGRLPVLALRPAPVQIKWVGAQFHTTGIAEVDAFISDPHETPSDLAGLYRENLLILPDAYVCYDPPGLDLPVSPLPAAETGRVTFGSFNALMKITPATLDAWADTLGRLPGSRLLLAAPQLTEEACARRLSDEFVRRGVGAERVETLGARPPEEILRARQMVDIALQPFPYCGGVTLLEDLWMGAPGVVLRGDTFAGRHGVSHLGNVGLADWIANTPESYVDLAVAQARDRTALQALRETLRRRLTESPICDRNRFARHFAAALRRAWADRCRRPETPV